MKISDFSRLTTINHNPVLEHFHYPNNYLIPHPSPRQMLSIFCLNFLGNLVSDIQFYIKYIYYLLWENYKTSCIRHFNSMEMNMGQVSRCPRLSLLNCAILPDWNNPFFLNLSLFKLSCLKEILFVSFTFRFILYFEGKVTKIK